MLRYYRNLYIIRRFQHNWIKPDGHTTGITVYNCVSKRKEPLIVRNKNCVTWYTCGPTVYDKTHIGHISCYVKLDIIQRILRNHFGLNLVTCMNITDIDDKIITKSKLSGIPIREITTSNEKEFWDDIKQFNIVKPNCIVRVTENVDRIIAFIKQLVNDGNAYKTSDGSVYFNIKKYKRYGKLQNLGDELLEQEDERGTADFALWKASGADEISWDSPWGKGRPGWHIECSTLATHIFGNNLDIHAGGIDLRFPHHENEEAQSCVYHNTDQWVNYWLHPGHLNLKNSEKMSKSLKNTISVETLLEITTPEIFRMACIMCHYRSSMTYSNDFMVTAGNVLKNYKNFIHSCNSYLQGNLQATINTDTLNQLINDSVQNIHNAMCDDFNTPIVVNILNDIVHNTNNMLYSTSKRDTTVEIVPVMAISNIVAHTMDLLGINLMDTAATKQDSNCVEIIDVLNDFRQEVRQLGLIDKNKNLLKLCDSVRDDLRKYGISIKDHGKKSIWSM